MMRPGRYATGCLLAALAGTTTACSQPTFGGDSVADGRARVIALINDTGAVLPSHADLGSEERSSGRVDLGFVEIGPDDLDRGLCYERFAGYAVRRVSAVSPEARVIVYLPASTPPASLLDDIEQRWRARGYAVDTSRRDDASSPQLRAEAGEYTVYATSLAEATVFADSPRLTMYATARCLREH